MNYMDFDPYLIRQSNEQMARKIDLLRLEQRLRGNVEMGDSRHVPLPSKGTLSLLRRVGLVR